MVRIWAMDWASNMDYNIDDQVYIDDDKLYRCIVPHTSSANFSSDVDNRELINMLAFFEVYNSNVTNCNASTTWTQMWWWSNSWPAENDLMFSGITSGINILKDMTVLAICNMYFESSTQRTNVGIEFTINGVRQNVMWASDYIRNTNWHNESSTSISQILELHAWDTVWVMMFQMAHTWTVSAPANKSNLLLKLLK